MFICGRTKKYYYIIQCLDGSKENGLYLTATDMDISVIEKIENNEAEVMQLGTITTSSNVI